MLVLPSLQVQRPGLTESILLDVYLLRSLLGFLRGLGRVKQDVRRLADELGRGLLAELDYMQVKLQTRRASKGCKHVA